MHIRYNNMHSLDSGTDWIWFHEQCTRNRELIEVFHLNSCVLEWISDHSWTWWVLFWFLRKSYRRTQESWSDSSWVQVQISSCVRVDARTKITARVRLRCSTCRALDTSVRLPFLAEFSHTAPVLSQAVRCKVYFHVRLWGAQNSPACESQIATKHHRYCALFLRYMLNMVLFLLGLVKLRFSRTFGTRNTLELECSDTDNCRHEHRLVDVEVVTSIKLLHLLMTSSWLFEFWIVHVKDSIFVVAPPELARSCKM